VSAERVGIVGLGLLGRGIAACFLGHGFEVVAFARSRQRQAEARPHIERMIGELVDQAGFDTRLRTDWPSRYQPATDFAALRGCSLVVESVVEDLAAKREVYDSIEPQVSPEMVIASNSSALPISLLQQGRRHPERFLGMHWAEPAHATRFLELIAGEQTSEPALQTAAALARRLGKDPSLCRKEMPGFIVNRMGYALYREALHLLEAGVADAETIDRSMRNALGLWATLCGPFRWMDLTGGPELYAKAMAPVLPTLSKADQLPAQLRKLVDSGARGIANGRGFFNYTPQEAQEWEDLYRRHAWRVTRLQNEYFPMPNKQPPSTEREQKLESLGYPLNRQAPEGPLVDAVAIAGNLVYASGQVPFDGNKLLACGKVPSQIGVEEATRAAALCAANVLRAVRARLGSLERIQRVLRLTGYVNADPGFTDCHLVVNGASNLVREVFGEAGRHARTALGLAQLPLGASVGVEMIFQLKD
jgi:3-hydroxybutyryl-CoA dehydrogenase